MEQRFIIHTRHSRKEFIRFNRAIVLRSSLARVGLVVVNIALLVQAYLCIARFSTENLIWLIAGLLIDYYFLRGINRAAAKAFEKNKFVRDPDIDLAFFDDHYNITTATGNSSVPYDKLHKIIETKTNFYLMYSPAQGVIIPKADTPEGFDAFMRQVKQNHKL